jgi:ABC-2 type transport system ATP-binding protein
MEYAIETIGLVKRYPTSFRQDNMGHFHGSGRVSSFGGFLDVLRGNSGSFIEALKGVNIKIKKGEIFGILGPNGAGKTTLIKILCTLVLRDEGEVYVNGFDPAKEASEVLKNLQAVLPESRGFNWRLNGRQNLEFYALLYGLNDNEARERIDYLLDFTELSDRANDGIQRYSSGMLRKLLLCRALLRNTPIIVFDEPTADLDPVSAAEFRKMIIDRLAHEEGKTILLSTHNLLEAQELCDRIAILDRGSVMACDTPNNIRHLITEDRFLKITFREAVSGDEQARLFKDIKTVEGVRDVATEVGEDGSNGGLSLRVAKDVDLAGILEIIVRSGLKIDAVNTVEPTLEEAFITFTGHGARQAQRLKGGG